MEKKSACYYLLGGFILGVLTASLVWLFISREPDARTTTSSGSAPAESLADGADLSAPLTGGISNENTGGSASEPSADAWDSGAVYTGGDTVSYRGRQYRAKWWTQGETPGASDVWEDFGILDGEPVQPEGVNRTPIDASEPREAELTDFKVVGYYPSWKPDHLQSVDFNIVTHVCYAFAIPTADGSLRDLENPETAKTLIRSAHNNGAKVLLSVGGWSYHDTPLENVFMEATADDVKLLRFTESILNMCEEYMQKTP